MDDNWASQMFLFDASLRVDYLWDIPTGVGDIRSTVWALRRAFRRRWRPPRRRRRRSC